MFLRILRTSPQILIEKFDQRNRPVPLIPAVNPFVGDVEKLWTPDAMTRRDASVVESPHWRQWSQPASDPH